MAALRTRNGFFTVKCSLEQLKMLDDWGYLDEAFQSVSCIHMSRRDVLGQAISYSIAVQTNQWTSLARQRGIPDVEPEYSHELISQRVAAVRRENAAITAFIKRRRLRCRRLVYEDLIADLDGEIRSVGEFLGIPLCVRKDAISLEKQADRRNELWRHRFLAETARRGALNGFEVIPGELRESAARFVRECFRRYGASRLAGGCCALGVGRGQFLSLLLECTANIEPPVPMVGFDRFTHELRQSIGNDFRYLYGEIGRLRLLQADPGELRPAAVRQHLGGDAAFMSIGAIRSPGWFEAGIELATHVLHATGIAVVGPFPATAGRGSMEQFFGSTETAIVLVPFAAVDGQLFLCRPQMLDEYSRFTSRFLSRNSNASWRRFIAPPKKPVEWTTATVLGQSIPVILG